MFLAHKVFACLLACLREWRHHWPIGFGLRLSTRLLNSLEQSEQSYSHTACSLTHLMRSLLAMRGTCVGCENTCPEQRINPTTATFSDTGQCGMREAVVVLWGFLVQAQVPSSKIPKSRTLHHETQKPEIDVQMSTQTRNA